MVPVPGHDTPVQPLVMAVPQGTVAAVGQLGMHSQRTPVQRDPVAQREPVPQLGPDAQRLGMVSPHASVAGSIAGHPGSHSQRARPGLHRSPSEHPVSQRPPHPSSEPHALVAVHRGVQVHAPVAGLHT